MSQRDSGFERIDADLYPTPHWVLEALAEYVDFNGVTVWEPACGNGQMARALEAQGATVFATDIHDHGFDGMDYAFDFSQRQTPILAHYQDIVTNPPYGKRCKLAEEFIERGLERLGPGGMLALLLPVDFDSAKTRKKFFEGCPMYAAKIVLTRRIKWFEPAPGAKKSTPSANHAWFIWVRQRVAPGWSNPLTLYAPTSEDRVAA